MSLYFWLEGRSSERKVYEGWLPELLPGYHEATRLDHAGGKTYYIISGGGQPAMFAHRLKDALRDIQAHPGLFTHLVVCFDAEDEADPIASTGVRERFEQHAVTIGMAVADRPALVPIVQWRCLETWLLGNRKMLKTNCVDPTPVGYVRHHDVSAADPEEMPLHTNFSHHAPFHHDYLRRTFAERGRSYTKARPNDAAKPFYLKELRARVADRPGHLRSFQSLLKFCETRVPPGGIAAG